jgi:hypothetical protein
VGFVVDKVALEQVFPPSTSVFPSQFHNTVVPLHEKMKNLIIFITGLHNKPQDCGASLASAAVPFSTHKTNLYDKKFLQNFDRDFWRTFQRQRNR